MKHIFIDCGYHLGEGLMEFTEFLKIDNNWEVHAFEPNPACAIEKKISKHPFKVNAYDKAVWIRDEQLLFNQQHQDLANSPRAGSSNTLDGWGSHIADTHAKHLYTKSVSVNAVDFSKFVEQFAGHKVFCKMDIEGAEFSVLRHMMANNTLRIINVMWVEWHLVNIPTETEATLQKLAHDASQQTILYNWK